MHCHVTAHPFRYISDFFPTKVILQSNYVCDDVEAQHHTSRYYDEIKHPFWYDPTTDKTALNYMMS